MLRFLLAAFFFLPLAAFATPKNLSVKIDGMTCDACATMIKDKISKVPNVDAASIVVTLKKKSATLSVADASAETIDAIKAAVASAGYKVVGEPKVSDQKKN